MQNLQFEVFLLLPLQANPINPQPPLWQLHCHLLRVRPCQVFWGWLQLLWQHQLWLCLLCLVRWVRWLRQIVGWR